MSKLEKIKPATYILPQEGGMRVPGLVIASEELLKDIEIDKPLEQVRNVAFLKGIVGHSIAMPDIHWGYGFPIGGVAAMDSETGVISPGGVGYDINCGVRLAIVQHRFESLSKKVKSQLLSTIFATVPSGVGHAHKSRGLSDRDYEQIAEKGAKWSVQQGYGFEEDLEHTESRGVIIGADIEAVSEYAKERGRKQLGSIGSGNHFVEIGEIQNVFLPDIASAWGVEKGWTYILIHSGSRGFGHQVCQDYLNLFVKAGYANDLPDPQLVCAPITSELGQRYFCAMAAAANYAFNNRQHILHYVRQAFFDVCRIEPRNVKMVYDVCHNIAKFETHVIDGVKKMLCVHRKGATRAYGPGEMELAPIFRKTGQPVLVPGDMGSASYLMAGLGNPLTWCSSCHGAGRQKSRVKSMNAWKGKDVQQHMENQGVQLLAASYRTIAEEMPDAYKNVDQVVEAVQEAGLANRVARLRPRLVIKG